MLNFVLIFIRRSGAFAKSYICECRKYLPWLLNRYQVLKYYCLQQKRLKHFKVYFRKTKRCNALVVCLISMSVRFLKMCYAFEKL